MESGVSEDAVSGHIQFIVPGRTACFECAPPLIVASGISEKTLKREGVCAASLPTTMGIVAGFLIQNTLKHLLSFGTTSDYLGYSSLTDFFPRDGMKPNPECGNRWCVQRQGEYQELLRSMPKVEEPVKEEKKVIHEDNEWGISLVATEEEDEALKSATVLASPEGTYREDATKTKADPKDVVQMDDGVDLSDLMGQLKSLSNK